LFARLLFQTFPALAIGCALAHPAAAGVISWDLSAAGIAGASAFTADALKATEVSHIVFDSPTTFFEHGFAKITGIMNDGVVSTPTGLNTDYSLYFDFTATGSVVTGHMSTFAMTLYAVNGVSTFGIDAGNNAFVDNGANSAVQLATNTLIDGTIAGAPGSDLSAESYSLFLATPAGAPALLGPQLPSILHGQFFHSISEPGGITMVADGMVLQGGDDTLSFVPEPSSTMLLLGGIPAILFLRRRPRK
jgi:hypothetical protein